jgi:hypothetical protein
MIESQIVARVLPSKCREAVKVAQRKFLVVKF